MKRKGLKDEQPRGNAEKSENGEIGRKEYGGEIIFLAVQ